MRIKRNTLYIVVASVLAAVTLIWVVTAFTAPTTKEEQRVLEYEATGSFAHQAYGQPVKREIEPNPKHYVKIIDAIAVSYSYSFFAEEPTSQATATVEISAIVADRGYWKRKSL